MQRTQIWVAALVLAVAACSDGPSGPSASVAVEPSAAQATQSAVVGTAVAEAPAVLVRDGGGEPKAGEAVWFRVTRGGGSVATSRTYTNAEGIATAGEWRLGAAPGENAVVAEVSGARAVEFLATGVAYTAPVGPVAPTGAYDITIRYIGTATARQQQAVASAVARWRSVIVGDLPSVFANAPAGACFESQPALNEVVDDILIFVEFNEIDGPGQVLGQAGPCYVRNDTGLPIIGQLNLDAADLQAMERAGTLDDVVMHEIGHVLGFGTLWRRSGLLDGSGTTEPLFNGAHAIAQYRAMGGAALGVPVENTGSVGTRDGHWRESVFGNELMTGYIGAVPNPLTALTAASLSDLGYNATTAGAASYTLGSLFQQGHALREPLDLRSRERILRPRFTMDRDGRKARLPDDPI
jgi:hypothetical protein